MLISYQFNDFLLEFEDSIHHNVFDDRGCSGITFTIEGDRYELIYNSVNWSRIFINRKDGSWQDLPFNEGTRAFIPNAITFTKRKVS